ESAELKVQEQVQTKNQPEKSTNGIITGYDSEIETFLMSSDISHIIIPDCNLQQFEKIASANPRPLRMNLIEGLLEIMPESEIIRQVANWKNANKNLVGRCTSSQ
ncbi:11847_t:CDS:2, partial [Diversispora eburnea]